MLDRPNVIGAIGEEVRASVDKAANSVIISFVIGGDTEEVGVDKVNKVLKEKGANQISKMVSYHKGGQSQTDVVLLNTKTGKVARAQSKNHFVSYFTNQNQNNNVIENFRWKVTDNLNLANFIKNLSNTDLGINLNDTDLTNVNHALVNNIWFATQGDVEIGGALRIHKLGKISGDDGLKSLEGAFENVLAGQVTNLLGITIAPNTTKIDTGGSNIFYLLNGRMKYTADLVHDAIIQLKDGLFKTLTTDKSRMVNVTITKGVVPSPHDVGEGDLSFAPSKVRYEKDSYGEKMGELILDQIKVTVSLGTSIQTLKQSSFTALM